MGYASGTETDDNPGTEHDRASVTHCNVKNVERSG